MLSNQFPSHHPTDQLTENMKKISKTGRAMGFLDAMDIVGMLSMVAAHPVEEETINRVYAELESGYSERYKVEKEKYFGKDEKKRHTEPPSDLTLQVRELLTQATPRSWKKVVPLRGDKISDGDEPV